MITKRETSFRCVFEPVCVFTKTLPERVCFHINISMVANPVRGLLDRKTPR